MRNGEARLQISCRSTTRTVAWGGTLSEIYMCVTHIPDQCAAIDVENDNRKT